MSDPATPKSLEFPCPRCDAAIDNAVGIACPACGGALTVCDGAYVLDGLLGRGGMGRVYAAVRRSDGARVAVKILHLGDDVDWKISDLFESSSRVLQHLDHPRLPRVHAFERDASGTMFLVREDLAGGTLADRVNTEQRRLEPARFRQLLADLLELLEYLHAMVPPVFHRDIKPSNIMFRTAGDWEPVLTDFDTVAAPGSQRTGITVVGTPGYTAPEQFAGIVSPASDLYALGTTLLFVATHTEPDRLPRIDGRFDLGTELAGMEPRLREVLLKLVAPERGDRYRNAREALDDLSGVSPKLAAVTAPALAPAPPPPISAGATRFVLGVCSLIIVSGLGFSGYLIRQRVARDNERRDITVPCTLDTVPTGASIVAVGLADRLLFAPDAGDIEIDRVIGEAPYRGSRQDWIFNGVIGRTRRIELRLPGYRTQVVGATPYAENGVCHDVSVALERER